MLYLPPRREFAGLSPYGDPTLAIAAGLNLAGKGLEFAQFVMSVQEQKRQELQALKSDYEKALDVWEEAEKELRRMKAEPKKNKNLIPAQEKVVLDYKRRFDEMTSLIRKAEEQKLKVELVNAELKKPGSVIETLQQEAKKLEKQAKAAPTAAVANSLRATAASLRKKVKLTKEGLEEYKALYLQSQGDPAIAVEQQRVDTMAEVKQEQTTQAAKQTGKKLLLGGAILAILSYAVILNPRGGPRRKAKRKKSRIGLRFGTI